MKQELIEKYNSLIEYLASLKSAAVAFSSGVDSTFLLYAAKEALGENVIAITVSSSVFPRKELKESKEFCEKIGVKQIVIDIDELQIAGFAQNPKNRCYLCKREIFTQIRRVASANGMAEVVEGSNLDDDGDYRPGLQAIAELGIKSPLRSSGLTDQGIKQLQSGNGSSKQGIKQLQSGTGSSKQGIKQLQSGNGFTKQEIRELSQYFNLPTWDKPSFACLASRFPYGDQITREKLGRVEQAEQILMDMGFRQMRVRIHGDVARIEVESSDFEKFLEADVRNMIDAKLKEIGFAYVALDLKGYRTGSMNEPILNREKP